MDHFISYSITEKIALLRGIADSRLTGQIVRVKTSQDSETQFSPNVDYSAMYQELCWSIANDPDYDADNAVHLACFNNQRTGVTIPIYL